MEEIHASVKTVDPAAPSPVPRSAEYGNARPFGSPRAHKLTVNDGAPPDGFTNESWVHLTRLPRCPRRRRSGSPSGSAFCVENPARLV